MGKYPISKKRFSLVENLMAFTAIEDDEIVGFFTMRRPSESFDELRFGFVLLAEGHKKYNSKTSKVCNACINKSSDCFCQEDLYMRYKN